MINILPDENERQVIDSIVDFLATHCPLERLRKGKGAAAAVERTLWAEMATLGWFGFGLSEAEGGAGFSIADEVLAFREFGRVVLTPGMLATSLAAVIAARAGDKHLAAEFASGKSRAALGNLVGAAAKPEMQIFDDADCDWICTWSAAGAGLHARTSLGPIALRESLDASVTLGRAAVIGKPTHWIEASREALPRRAELLVAAQLTGMAEAARDMAAGYANLRVQFGKPIGSFQAVAHHCADMALRAEAATSQLYFAAIAERDGREDATHQVAAALLVAGDAAFQNATLNIRVHGGIGFTAECDAHHFLKRAVLYRAITGGTAPHQQRLLATPSTT